MSTLSRETVLAALKDVIDPASGQSLVETGLVSGVVVRGGNVGFLISATPETAAQMEAVRREAELKISLLPGVEKVTAVLTAEHSATAPAPEKERPAQWNRTPVEGVRHILAVASGKGGVGKSTATVCLARALAESGLRVGILDADIYGPSIPLMLGVSGQPGVEDGRMLPKKSGNIACMSIGLLLGEDAAVLRAPMITKALNQMLRGVKWDHSGAPLDVLLIDMPPGTGDVHLSLAQQVPLSGAVVVTTPQRVATLDAQKAVQMFRKVSIPVLGILENMSFLETPAGKVYPFGQGGGERLAKEMATLFLGEVPLDPALGAALDKGEASLLPTVFHEVAATLGQQLPFRA